MWVNTGGRGMVWVVMKMGVYGPWRLVSCHDLLNKAIIGLILSCCPAEFAVNSLPGACTHRWSQSQRDDTVGNRPPNLHRELNHQEQPRSHRHDSTYYRKSHDSDAPVGIEWKRLDWSDS